MIDDFSENAFLDLLYEAVLEPNLWISVMERLGDQIGGGPAILTTIDRATGAGSALTARVGSDTVDNYLSYYAGKNPLLQSARHDDYQLRFVQKVVIDEQVVDRAAFVSSEYYNDFLRPIAAEWKMIFRLGVKGKDLSALVVARPHGKGRFTDDALAKATRLSPHLVRVFALSRKLALKNAFGDHSLQALESPTKGLLILDEEGVVRHANSTADSMMTIGASLSVQNGRLICLDPAEDWRLSGLLQAARSKDPQQRRGGSIRQSLRDTPSLSISVTPLRSDSVAGFIAAGSAIMVCLETLDDPRTNETKLKTMFALTGAESRVALALYEGLSTREVATRLNVSVNTVRAQLNSVFVKSGTHRQAELVSRIAAGLES